jgi:hypothetical protein
MTTTATPAVVRRRRAALAAALLSLGIGAPMVLSAPGAQAADPLIQPGEYIETIADGAASGCTLGFVFDGVGGSASGRVFASTAAHCVDAVGDPVKLIDGTVFGTVAVIGNEDSIPNDYALIEVASEFLDRVNPAVKGYPDFPTGSTVSADTALGDKIQISGYGTGFDLTAATRQSRQARLTYDNADQAGVLAPIIYGDSGGPLVHSASGKALGLVSRACLAEVCEEVGPTVEGILVRLSAQGFEVQLRVVDTEGGGATTTTSTSTTSTTTAGDGEAGTKHDRGDAPAPG